MIKILDNNPEIIDLYKIKYYEGGIHTIIDEKHNVYTSFYQSPTGNCQVASACSFDALLDVFSAKFIRNLIILAKNSFCKRMLILDVEKKYIPYIHKVFKDTEIVIEQEYHSTNSSDMCMYLINIENL
jgi:hypothetical protein